MLERTAFQNLNFHNVLNTATNAITVAECAALSSYIYGNGSIPPTGWDLLHFCSGSHGYAGACYVRNLLTMNAQLIFVHRGTVVTIPDVIENIIGDIQLALGYIPVQTQSIIQLMQAVSEKIMKIYKMDDESATDAHELMKYLSVASTGHSLGAVLSDITALLTLGVQSVTFDNPGSKPVIQTIMNSMSVPLEAQMQTLSLLKTKCSAYQGGVNLINSCNEQVGRTFRIDDLIYAYKLNVAGVMAFPPSPSYLSNFTYSIDNTFDQHSIAKIEEYLKKGNSSTEINNPIGGQAGYIEYVNPKNTKYWNGYLNAIWESDSVAAAAIRLKYNNKEEFRVHGFQQLTIVYDELSKKPLLLNKQSEQLFSPQLNFFNEQTNNQSVDAIINEFTVVEKDSLQEASSVRWCSVM